MLFTKLVPVLVACASAASALHHPAGVAWLPRQLIDVRAPAGPKLLATRTQVEARDVTVAARQATCPPQPLPSSSGCACASQTLCGTTCVDTSTDNNNCGECGAKCFSNEVCTQGVCACSPGTNECFPGICVNFQTDPNNCGSCQNACYGAKNTCKSGTCQCPTGEKVCPAGTFPTCCAGSFKGTPTVDNINTGNGTLASRAVDRISPATVSEVLAVAHANHVTFKPNVLGGITCTELPTDRCLSPGDCTGAVPLCCKETFNNGVFDLQCSPLA
ncbi:hypothetical protein EXIGLDRAFT_843909 [Exidia glandulosa HHB12029]|uniref:Uncharacterized protein n=1 Tax=Exidia glandulosa HHB12029 TaxID=1314781 RepID=A0A165CD33_EXIGL|nr:hypothetical protein EXIGLDRAFT_843909 [Exidia glandulosa HHB12029]